MAKDAELDALVSEFTQKISALMESRTRRSFQVMLAPFMQGGDIALPGKRKAQLCPVPGCENTAAPRYGMVCVEHKDLPKGEIKKYREERKAQAKTESESTAHAAPVTKKPGRRLAVPVK